MKKLLVIGAGFLQSFVIGKANDMGYITYAVDADPGAVGFTQAAHHEIIDIVDEEACLSYARKNRIDGVLTAATDYGVLTASYIAQEMGLRGLSYKTAKLIKNKFEVRKCLFKNQIDDSEQAYEVDKDTDIEDLEQWLVYPVIVKPCDGSGSRGAGRVDKADDLKYACEYAMSNSITHKAEIESFIVGKEYGVESLVVDGQVHVLGVMQKWMTKPPYYAELGHALPNDLNPETEMRVRTCVKNAIKALDIDCGSVNMDVLIAQDGRVHIVDVGARMGGNMIGPCVIPYGTGIDYVAAMIQNSVGDPINFSQIDSTAVATRLLAFDGGIIRRLPNMQELEKKYQVEIYHHMQTGQKVNEYHTNIDGCGYIIARAETKKEAVEKAEKVLSYLKNNIF